MRSKSVLGDLTEKFILLISMFNFLVKPFAPKISVHVVSRDRTFETTGLNDLNIGFFLNEVGLNQPLFPGPSAAPKYFKLILLLH
jgi:hypothetical protein